MSIFDRNFGGRVSAGSRDPSDDYWYQTATHSVSAGVPVTVERALTLPIIYDCLQVLSQSVGALPFNIFERRPDGSKRRRDQHPLMAVLRDPNPETTDIEFFGQMMFDLASEGNAFIELTSGPNGQISELWRHEPSRVQVERVSDGSKRYRITLETGEERIFLQDEIWHLKSFPHCNGGLRGTSPIHAGREAIGAALALQDYAARFFRNDCTPPFVIEHPNHFKDDISKDNFLAALKRWWGGSRRHSPGVLEHGMKLNRVGVNNEEAQFLETKVALDSTIARLWRMPPHKVGILDKATFSNIEQQSLEFVTDTLLPWIRLIEKSIAKNLIIRSDRFYFEFNVAGLLRGDLKARYEAYAQARQWGWLSINDIRKRENMNPVRGGDQYLTPMNMTPVGTPANRSTGEIGGVYTIFGPDGTVVSRVVNGNPTRQFGDHEHEHDRDNVLDFVARTRNHPDRSTFGGARNAA